MFKLNTIKTLVTSKAARQVLKVQKHSPILLFSAGVIGVVGTVILASRATLKLEEVLEEGQRNLAKVQILIHQDYSEEDRKKDLGLCYLKMTVNVAKLYAPAVLVGAASIAALTGAHVVLSRRNMGLTAAYAAVDQAYKEYRRRVIGEYGEDKDREFRYGVTSRDIVEDTPEGPVVTQLKSFDPNVFSPYARFFDELNPNWSRTPEYNLLFLRCQQNYANDLLHSRGHLFLNEVYDMLGAERSRAGAVVGWVISKNGDNFVDFGIFNGKNPKAIDFVNGQEGAILLDFNVDGVIFDKIKE